MQLLSLPERGRGIVDALLGGWEPNATLAVLRRYPFMRVRLVIDGSGNPPYRGDVLVECTDTGDSWLVALAPGQVTVTRPEQRPRRIDAGIAGPAADLYLVLWGRLPLDPVEPGRTRPKSTTSFSATRFRPPATRSTGRGTSP